MWGFFLFGKKKGNNKENNWKEMIVYYSQVSHIKCCVYLSEKSNFHIRAVSVLNTWKAPVRNLFKLCASCCHFKSHRELSPVNLPQTRYWDTPGSHCSQLSQQGTCCLWKEMLGSSRKICLPSSAHPTPTKKKAWVGPDLLEYQNRSLRNSHIVRRLNRAW